jgi:hypothetical protein
VRKTRRVSSILARSGGLNSRGADTWKARSTPPFHLRDKRLRCLEGFTVLGKKEKRLLLFPHFAVVIVFLIAFPYHCYAPQPLLCKRFYSHATAMGKRGSSAADATAGAAKKAKKKTKSSDSDAPTVGN